jgi:hypothetical protein
LDSGIFEWATGSDEDNSHEASGSNCREEITEERAELLEKADERFAFNTCILIFF